MARERHDGSRASRVPDTCTLTHQTNPSKNSSIPKKTQQQRVFSDRRIKLSVDLKGNTKRRTCNHDLSVDVHGNVLV